MRRFFFISLTLALVVAMLGAALPAHTPAKAEGGVHIVVWATGSEPEAAMMQAAADLWAAKTGNTIEIVPTGWDTAHAQDLTAATSGEGPDIITGGLSWGIEFGQLGGMIDLAKAYPDEVAAMKEADNPGIWASIETLDGEVYAVPWDLTIYLMYYRPDLLEQLGVEAPKTWDDIVTVNQAVKDANDSEGGFMMGWGNMTWLSYANYLYQAGGNFYDAECNVTIESDAALEALEFYASLYTDYGVSQDTALDLGSGLDSGLYSVGADGSWLLGGLDASHPDMAGKWAIGTLPANPTTGDFSTFIGGRVIGVMSYSPNAEIAWDFIKFLYTEEAVKAEVAAGVAQNILYIPPQTAFQDYIAYGDNAKETIKSQLTEAVGPPSCTGWEEAANEVTAQIEAVVLEGADPEEALAGMAAKMEELLGQ